MKKKLALLMACIMLLSISGFANAELTDGNYTGAGLGMGLINVDITVEGGKITAASVTGNDETPSIGGAHLDELAEQIVAAQGANIDGVSGCTITSNGVREAAAAALQGVSAEKAPLADGIYTAEAFGFHKGWSDKIIVTIENGAIKAIEFGEDCGDTPPMLDTVERVLFPRIIEQQSIGVDALTGATLTSAAAKAGVEDCLIQALKANGADASDISAYKTIAEMKGGYEELNTQVLVIGMGGSGTYCAVRASEMGADVLVIEKQARYGGTTALTQEIESINPPRIKDLYHNGEDYCDAEAMKQDWLEYVEGDAKPEMVDLFFENSGPALDWLAVDHGVPFDFDAKVGFTEADIYPVKFQWWPNFSEEIPGMFFLANKDQIARNFDNLVASLTENGGKYMLETEAYELLFEDGKVVGAKAHNLNDGTEYVIKADAVVLATGGFAGSGEMTTKYLSDEYYPLKGEWKVYGSLRNDGKMIQSAIDNGAATYNIGMPPEVHMSGSYNFIPRSAGFEVHEVEGVKSSMTGVQSVWSVADLPMFLGTASNSLAVDINGNRFTSETGLAMLDPWIAGPNFYSIWSTEQIDAIKENGFRFSTDGVAAGFLSFCGAIPENLPLPEAYDVLDYAIDMGYVFKADTVEELAALLDMSPETLAETVSVYNGYCENGEDEEFGKPAEFLDKIGNGPFYAVKMASYCYCTCAGLDVNEDLMVLDTEGKPMEGLFAVGCDSMGVLFTEKRPYVTYGGANNGWGLTSGYVAGGKVAEYVGAKS